MNKFYPKMYKHSIYDINYNKLLDNNIKCIVFDLDNTIALIDQDYIEERCRTLFKELDNNFITVIISNNTSKKRVKYYADILNCDFVYSAKKPFLFGINKIMKKYKLSGSDIAVVGDQLVTDILLANRNKSYSILIDPLGKKDLKITSLNRFIESKILNKYLKLGIFKKGDYYE